MAQSVTKTWYPTEKKNEKKKVESMLTTSQLNILSRYHKESTSKVGSRSRPRATDGGMRVEEIRQLLGLNQSDYSLRLGFRTVGGYNSALKNGVSEMLMLAAEGLLATTYKHPNAIVSQFIVTIKNNGETSATPFKPSKLSLGGKEYMIIDSNL